MYLSIYNRVLTWASILGVGNIGEPDSASSNCQPALTQSSGTVGYAPVALAAPCCGAAPTDIVCPFSKLWCSLKSGRADQQPLLKVWEIHMLTWQEVGRGGGGDPYANMTGGWGGGGEIHMLTRQEVGGGGDPYANMAGGWRGGDPYANMAGGWGGGDPYANMAGGWRGGIHMLTWQEVWGGGGGDPYANMTGSWRGGGDPYANMAGGWGGGKIRMLTWQEVGGGEIHMLTWQEVGGGGEIHMLTWQEVGGGGRSIC